MDILKKIPKTNFTNLVVVCSYGKWSDGRLEEQYTTKASGGRSYKSLMGSKVQKLIAECKSVKNTRAQEERKC